MKDKLLPLFLCLILIFSVSAGTVTAFAEADNDTAVGKVRSLADGIVAFKMDQSDTDSVQNWVDTSLAQNAGINAEWYIIALAQSGEYDFSEYKRSLSDYLASNVVHSASARQKLALAYLATGSNDPYIDDVLKNSFGQLGIMSWVYGLHLLNNGCVHDTETAETVIDTLLGLQLEDGGWALTGTKGDTDVTAMVVQALAPHCKTDIETASAVEKALSLLSEYQLDDGGFSSYGTPNPESAAQVIVALSSLGIDCEADERFIKNGNSPIDAIEGFRLADGGFSHTLGGEYSDNATAQVFYSMIAYIRMAEGKGGLYILDNLGKAENDYPARSENSSIHSEEDEINGTQDSKTSYKLWVCIAIIGVGTIICLVLFATKRRNKKNFIAVFIIIAAAVCFVLFTDFQTPDSYYNGSDTSKDAVGTVTITIRCDTVAGNTDSEYIPENGMILSESEFEIAEGDTVYNILVEAARKHGIQVESKGAEGIVYISGINYLYEFDFGDLSGWMYFVNGEEPSKGCDAYVLKDGDRIEWFYTCELGNDLN